MSELNTAPECFASYSSSLRGYEEVRQKFETLWKRYLDWRNGCTQHDLQATRDRTTLSLSSRTSCTTFLKLTEIQAAVRDALLQQCSSAVPLDFVMALMEAAADTTARYMAAKRPSAAIYQTIAFELLWSGLSQSEIKIVKQDKEIERLCFEANRTANDGSSVERGYNNRRSNLEMEL